MDSDEKNPERGTFGIFRTLQAENIFVQRGIRIHGNADMQEND